MPQKYGAVRMRKIVVLVMVLPMLGCSPVVEEVTYSDHANVVVKEDFENYLDQINSLTITVNTKKGLFGGRESFLSFKRDYYAFFFRSRSDHYGEADVILMVPGLHQEMSKLSDATFEIQRQADSSLIIVVSVNDPNVPEVINGRYEMRVQQTIPPYYTYYVLSGRL
jgi:hypothetical protein